jgi:act minimal PKS chain-length factor (CLF/KS beta)
VIPPAVGIDRLSPDCPVDLVRDEPRQARVRTALVLARGHRGFNAALVLRAAD